LPVAAMFVNGSGRNEQSQQRTFHSCFLPSFGSFGEKVSEEWLLLLKIEISLVVNFRFITNQNELKF
jgi:hypothetical protein